LLVRQPTHTRCPDDAPNVTVWQGLTRVNEM